MCARALVFQKDSEGKIFPAVLPCAQQFRPVCNEIFFARHQGNATKSGLFLLSTSESFFDFLWIQWKTRWQPTAQKSVVSVVLSLAASVLHVPNTASHKRAQMPTKRH
jgi:hypothetical protein